MEDGGHAFYVGEDTLDVTVGGRRYPLWRCSHCYAVVPGWLLTEGLYDRCLRPHGWPQLLPATQHRDPRRTRTP